MAVCGTSAGWWKHRRANESACAECRRAWSAYVAERRKPEHGRAGRERRPSPRKLYPESTKAADQRRRAIKMGATAEKFTSAEVFERDEWVCGICSEPVDASVKYPDPASPSLDHIVPLSLGGDHTRANTRCSHLGCNVRRGNRVTQTPGGSTN